MASLRRVGFVALGAVAVITAVLAFRARRRDKHPAGGDTTEAIDEDAAIEPWCAEGLTPIAGGGCFASPEGAALPLPLVIYLHGMYEKATPQEELDRQHRVAARATAAGYAVLALRSSLAACHPTDPTYQSRYCWPSNEEVADRAAAFVTGWETAMREADQRVGKGPRYVLGFSSGAFFAGLLAVRALYPAEAFVVAHGGPVEPVKPYGRKTPMLLLSADDDLSQDWMVKLDAELTREEWPHAHAARGGGHALTDWDIESSLGFFTEIRREPGTVRGPASGHAPRGREHEASTDAPAATEAPAATNAAPTRVDASARKEEQAPARSDDD